LIISRFVGFEDLSNALILELPTQKAPPLATGLDKQKAQGYY